MTMGGPEISGRRESDRSGLRVLLYVLLALGGVGVLTCGGLLFVAARNPAVRQLAETMAGSQSAPGTQQLRDAGCAVAQVFDIGNALAQLSEFNNWEIDEVDALTGLTVVQCMLPKKNSGGLGCDEVAQVYSSAVSDPPDRFLVHVTVPAMFRLSSRTDCEVVYAADGSPIAPVEQYDPDAMPGVEP